MITRILASRKAEPVPMLIDPDRIIMVEAKKHRCDDRIQSLILLNYNTGYQHEMVYVLEDVKQLHKMIKQSNKAKKKGA